MDIIGSRRFVEIPGERKHELPPLLVRSAPPLRDLDTVVDMANGIIESEDMLLDLPREDSAMQDLDLGRRKMDLAINLVEQYLGLLGEWRWGDAILEWIRQCEITFDSRSDLRNLLRNDLWPHAGRSSFVQLLSDKAVSRDREALEKAVGLRLTFRQPPPIACFSNQFLFYLNSSVAHSAYHTWSKLSPDPVSALPPERFHFDVLDIDGPLH